MGFFDDPFGTIKNLAEDAYNEGRKAAETVGNAVSDGVNAVKNVVNTSKGVDYFVYLSGRPFKVNVSSRGTKDRTFASDSNDLVGKIQQDHCEISMSDIGKSEHSGRFQIAAGKNDAIYLSKYAEIAPSTGNLNGSDMGDMLQTPSIVKDDFAVSYGFYDAGKDESHQAYMYVTDNYSNWMGNLIHEMPGLKNKSFGTFVLPGSHDAGMFRGLDSDEAARDLIHKLIWFYGKDYKALAAAIIGVLGISINLLPIVLPALIAAITVLETTSAPKRALINLAYTQKDDIDTQLKLGVRYFDFRPGYNPSFYKTDNMLRHQHCFIPGYEFDKFLSDVVTFLKTHQQEIVVVNVKYSGFLQSKEMEPSMDIVNSSIDRSLSGSGITKGKVEDLKRTVEDLLKTNTRVIFLYHNDESRDSYSDNYATNNADTIISALNSTFKEPEKNWTVLQLQGTYNGTKEGIAKAVATFSDASSPLLSTKAKFDYKTYDWVSKKENVASRCGSNLLVLLNDFVDNALVSHSIAITKQRLK